MSDIQSIFDKVIKDGWYDRNDEYMCISLRTAFRYDIITCNEYMYAISCIKKYLGNSESDSVGDVRALASVLEDNNLPFSFDDTLAIYKDWERRPTLKESL